MKRRLLPLVVGLILFSTAACSAGKIPPPMPVTEAYELYNDRLPAPDSLRVQAKVDYFDDKNHERVVGRDFVISAQEPASLRVTLSSFDKALSTLVTNGDRFWLIDTMQNIFAQGSATAENISRILPLYLSAADLYRVLTGEYPIEELAPEWREEARFDWDAQLGAFVLTQPRLDGSEQRVYFSYPDWNVTRIVHAMGDEELYSYEAKEFISSEEDGLRQYPLKIAFHIHAQKLELRLRVQKRDENVTFKPQVFELKAPQGVEIVVMP